jgi:hypothetical protein
VASDKARGMRHAFKYRQKIRAKAGEAYKPNPLTDGKLTYPKDASEFEIQSFIYTELRKRGLDARGEVRTTSSKSRFDIVVFDAEKKPIRIIEVKVNRLKKNTRNESEQKEISRRVEQLARYARQGVQIDVVFGMKEAAEYVLRWDAVAVAG